MKTVINRCYPVYVLLLEREAEGLVALYCVLDSILSARSPTIQGQKQGEVITLFIYNVTPPEKLTEES